MSSIDDIFNAAFDAVVSPMPPWTKACDRCALKPNDPMNLGQDVQVDIIGLVKADQMQFLCLHRKDETGGHRECACAAAHAKNANARLARTR